mmetsp:Transcript_5809/g.13987  ORF Transcript_5809/g.13987 Transcript_5809/m.13987 type:complete len:104 (-) Transcript_5809:2013-2324(-)
MFRAPYTIGTTTAMNHLNTLTGPTTMIQSTTVKKHVEKLPIAGFTSSCNNNPGKIHRRNQPLGWSSPVMGSNSPVKNLTKTSKKQMTEMIPWTWSMIKFHVLR